MNGLPGAINSLNETHLLNHPVPFAFHRATILKLSDLGKLINVTSNVCKKKDDKMIYFVMTVMEMSLRERFEGKEGKRKFSLFRAAPRKPKRSSICTTPRGGQK